MQTNAVVVEAALCAPQGYAGGLSFVGVMFLLHRERQDEASRKR